MAKTVPRVIALGVLLLFVSAANAVPVLQLYLEGGTYDDATETWVLAGGDNGVAGRLWVIGDTGGHGGAILNAHLAIAYDSAYSVTIDLTPSQTYGYGEGGITFTDPSIPADPTLYVDPDTGLSVFTEAPTLNDGSLLPTHGLYGDGTVWQRFDIGDLTLRDSQIADFTDAFPTSYANSWGQINVYEVAVSGTGLPEDFFVHFDLYNSLAANNSSVFAPFSHDAGVWPTPEPASMIMLGCLGAGMLAARRMRRGK